MNLSNLPSSVSIIILNSSHPSIDDVTSVLKSQIDSGQRPHLSCLSADQIEVPNVVELLKSFIASQSEKFAKAMEKERQIEDFNQLDEWKRELEMKKIKKKPSERRSLSGIKKGIQSELKTRRDYTQSIIIDFPLDNEAIKLYLILFDVYDCDLIKAILSFDSSLKAIVNLSPRIIHGEELSIKAESWQELLRLKNGEEFENVAFLDLDVPILSPLMLKRQSKMIYEQFCHFFYDIEEIKSNFEKFRQRLEIVAVETNVKADDARELAKRLERIPDSMLTVEAIYDEILEQTANEREARKSSTKSSKSSTISESSKKQPFKVELFTKNFADANDALGDASHEVYAAKIEKLESELHFWEGVGEVSVEKRQLLNYFMQKLLRKLEMSGSSEHLEFYIYLLQFQAMERNLPFTSRNFHEVRSVTRGKTTTEAELLNLPPDCSEQKTIKAAISDCHVDYMNRSKIPEEMSQLVDDIGAIQSAYQHEKNFVQMLSSSAMIQRLAFLIKSRPSFTPQHFALMDVLLVKFHRIAVPQMFTTRSYSRVLPTPLCFRDFNGFEKPEMKPPVDEQVNSKVAARSSEIKLQDFFLATSIKYRLWKEGGDSAERNSIVVQTENVAAEAVEKDVLAYDVSASRIQFRVTESEFHSVHIAAKALNFHWLHRQHLLDFYCQLHDASLAVAHDLDTNNLLLVTLEDSDGIKCSLDKTAGGSQSSFLKRWNVLLSLPNGVEMRNLGDEAVQQTWKEGKSSLSGERRRVWFASGFVLIESNDGGLRVFAWNGSVFEVNSKSRKSQHDFGQQIADRDAADYAEATILHQHSIDSIQFLKSFVDISSYTMVIPSGERFVVEHGTITEMYEKLQSIEKFDKRTGNLHIVRADGVKTLHGTTHSKVLFADGTVITTWQRNDSIATAANDDDELNEPVSERIWSSESENESKFVVNHIMKHISDDYFLKTECSHQFEHKHCGAVRFDGDTSFKLFNGTTVASLRGSFSVAMGNSSLVMDDLHLLMSGKKCSECSRSCEFFIEFPLESVDEESHKRLLSARDCYGNTFEIKRDGRHAFYDNDSYDTEPCPQCSSEQEAFQARNYGERRVVLNRDYSGYEITPFGGKRAAFIETADEVLTLEGPEQFCYNVYVADVDVDFYASETPPVVADDTLSPVLPERSASSIKSSGSDVRRKKSKRASKRGSTLSQSANPPVDELEISPSLAAKEAISRNISAEHAKLIQLYANPLEDIPATVAAGAMIKLNRRINLVSDALFHLKKYSSEKFIFNAGGLVEAPVGKKEFEENFKLVVRKTIGKFVREKLEILRQSIAADVIKDLLYDSVKEDVSFDEAPSISTESTDSIPEPALPIPIKSFSFI